MIDCCALATPRFLLSFISLRLCLCFDTISNLNTIIPMLYSIFISLTTILYRWVDVENVAR